MITLVPCKNRTYPESLILSDLNSGVVMCKKMGLKPIGVIFGQKEKEDMRHFAHSGKGGMNFGLRGTLGYIRKWGMTPMFCDEERHLTFICESK